MSFWMGVPPPKAAAAGQQEIERGAQAVDVGPDVHHVAVHRLLGGHVVHGADRALGVPPAEVVGRVVEEAGQAEVEDFDRTRPVEEQVGRLDVAVDQAGLVGVLQAEGGLADVVGGPHGVHRPVALDDGVQRAAVNVLHDEEVQPAVAVDVVTADDVGVLELGDGPRLAAEALQGHGVAGAVGEHLDGDAAAHDRVLAQVDLAHAAGAERPQHLVLATEDEVAPLAAQQLLDVEARQQAVAHQGVGRRPRPVGQGAAGAPQPGLKLLRLHQSAAGGEVEEFVRG
jgi:hypothetical protein